MDFTPVQHLSLPSGPLAYRQMGGGPPLLLIHGWRGSSRHWQGTLEACADIRRTFAIDLPGHGETPPRRERIDLESLAGLVMELADRSGLDRFDLVGHSFGAALGAFIAARWPGRVRRLVLTSLGAGRTGGERTAMGQAHSQMDLALRLWRPWLALGRPWLTLIEPWIDYLGDSPALCRTIAGAFLRQLPDDDGLVRDGVREFLRTDPVSALEIAIASGSPVLLPALEMITAPTLLVRGSEDRIMPVSAVQALAGRLATGRLVQLPDCGHLPMIERPGAYHRLVREFLIGAVV